MPAIRPLILTSAILAVIVVGVSLGIFYALPSLGRNTAIARTTTSSIQNINQTFAATNEGTYPPVTSSTFSTMPSSESTAISTTTTSVMTTASTMTSGDNFTYMPTNSTVEILSVAAYVNPNGSGNESLSFGVNFQNVGSQTIYVIRGGVGAGFNATIVSGSAETREINTAMCMIAEAPSPVAPGNASSVMTPGCWSGCEFVLLHPGTIDVQLILTWSVSTLAGQTSSVVIMAEFAVTET